MKQNVGLSALIIAAFAFVMRTGGHGPQPSQSARTQDTPVRCGLSCAVIFLFCLSPGMTSLAR
jgi:uncharacterized membrane protein YgaE (UPF0421/DUF939 family)